MKTTKKHRDEVLKSISDAWGKYPDLRLCQLILNCKPSDHDMYYWHDKGLITKIKELYPERRAGETT